MKTILAVAGCMIVLVAVVASVPLDSSKNHRSKESSLRNQLFDMASLNKRSMVNLPHPMRMQQPQEQPEEPEEWYPEEKNEEKAAEAYLMQMSTPDLLRMLELLDMLETKDTMKASERELATLQYLLKSYEK